MVFLHTNRTLTKTQEKVIHNKYITLLDYPFYNRDEDVLF